ncbi:hypothetical protein [Aliagarivorans taiwanensis]|uniref:hypothetical protein n=1 Tax=Aliagarivorans taiwanensis TaxID=561966 RepID=UPI0004050E36|nr:hypothetical protein [Aliagarivorans taiwanensis]
MQVSQTGFSAAQYLSSAGDARIQPTPPRDIVDRIKDEYDKLSPEQQLQARRAAEGAVADYQAGEQAKTDAKRNTALQVNQVQHQDKLVDIYLQTTMGGDKSGSSRSDGTWTTVQSINDSIENQQKVDRYLKTAGIYAQVRDWEQAPRPELLNEQV